MFNEEPLETFFHRNKDYRRSKIIAKYKVFSSQLPGINVFLLKLKLWFGLLWLELVFIKKNKLAALLVLLLILGIWYNFYNGSKQPNQPEVLSAEVVAVKTQSSELNQKDLSQLVHLIESRADNVSIQNSTSSTQSWLSSRINSEVMPDLENNSQVLPFPDKNHSSSSVSFSSSAQSSSQSLSSSSYNSVLSGFKLAGYGCRFSWNSDVYPMSPTDSLRCDLVDNDTDSTLLNVRDCTIMVNCLISSRVFLGNFDDDYQEIIEYGSVKYYMENSTDTNPFSVSLSQLTSISPSAGGPYITFERFRVHVYAKYNNQITLKSEIYELKYPSSDSYFQENHPCSRLRLKQTYTLECFPGLSFDPNLLDVVWENNSRFYQKYDQHVKNYLEQN